MREPTIGAVLLFVLSAVGASAQPAPASTTAPAMVVPRFRVEPSPLQLSGDARARQYLGVVGRRAAWLGSETGEAELWVHPLKLATRFRLDFTIPDYVDPIRGADVARTVDVRPELTTITYSHATFTVRQTETDGDGLIENTTGGLGAIEVGAIGEGIHQDIYLAAVWVQAIAAMREMAAVRSTPDVAARAAALEPVARRSLDEKYWLPGAGHHAFGILKSGGTSDTLTVWPATAAAFGLFDRTRGAQTMQALSGHALTADWGARMLTTTSPLYEPLHYNMGAVWPFVSGFVAAGHYRYGRPWAGYPLIEALTRLTFDFARGRHAELLSGHFYRPLDTAVPHQFFATSMLVTPIMSGLLGWEPDAAHARATLAPQLPPHWDRVTVRNLRVGGTTLDVVLTQGPGRLHLEPRFVGPPVALTFDPALPPGATARKTRRPARVGTSATATEATWRGGLAVSPVTPGLQPGDPSNGLRVRDFTWDGARGTLLVEGIAGRTYELRLIGDLPGTMTPLVPVRPIPGGHLVSLSIPPAAGSAAVGPTTLAIALGR